MQNLRPSSVAISTTLKRQSYLYFKLARDRVVHDYSFTEAARGLGCNLEICCFFLAFSYCLMGQQVSRLAGQASLL